MGISRLVILVCLMAALTATASASEEFLLYAPKPAAGDQLPASPDQGVLVRRITVKRGDTLKKLSREHIGVASYFPQVLLFNTIKNPDLIHPGEKLLVPVKAGHLPSVTKAAKRKTEKRAGIGRHHRRQKLTKASKVGTAVAAATGERETFQQAKRAYLVGDYHRSLNLFDSFLSRFPRSELAADAALYRADSLLRLSGQ